MYRPNKVANWIKLLCALLFGHSLSWMFVHSLFAVVHVYVFLLLLQFSTLSSLKMLTFNIDLINENHVMCWDSRYFIFVWFFIVLFHHHKSTELQNAVEYLPINFALVSHCNPFGTAAAAAAVNSSQTSCSPFISNKLWSA